MNWYTSDTHFFHRNSRGTGIIDYCKRPFRDLDHMHEELIARWNRRVEPSDTIFHLGDFAFGNKEQKRSVLVRLNGIKVLVKGNHDAGVSQMLDVGFNTVVNDAHIVDGGYDLFLRHEPYLTFDIDVERKYDFHLCGHVHEEWKSQGRIINVGVDQWDFEPKSLDELLGGTDMDPVL